MYFTIYILIMFLTRCVYFGFKYLAAGQLVVFFSLSLWFLFFSYRHFAAWRLKHVCVANYCARDHFAWREITQFSNGQFSQLWCVFFNFFLRVLLNAIRRSLNSGRFCLNYGIYYRAKTVYYIVSLVYRRFFYCRCSGGCVVYAHTLV